MSNWFHTKIAHPATRSLLPLAIFLLGGIFVLSSEFLEHFVARVDAGVASWWARVTGLPAGEAHVSKLFTEHFFAEVGIALMVAGLMAIFVEFIFHSREEQERAVHAEADEKRHLRHVSEDTERHHRQLEQLQKSVFQHVLGSMAPSWLSDKVVDLYKAKVLREEVQVTYTFEAAPEKIERLGGHKPPSLEDLLTVTVDVHYQLRNLTDEWTACEIEHGFSPTVPLPAATSGFISLVVIRGKKPEGGRPRREGLNWCRGQRDECIEYVVPSDTDRLGWKSRTIAVNERFQIGPKDTMDVKVRFQSIRWRYDHVTWITRVPAASLTVMVNLKDGCPLLDFSLERSHPKPFIQAGRSVPSERSFMWQSDGPVLPFQGFSLNWFPEPETIPSEPVGGRSIPVGLQHDN